MSCANNSCQQQAGSILNDLKTQTCSNLPIEYQLYSGCDSAVLFARRGFNPFGNTEETVKRAQNFVDGWNSVDNPEFRQITQTYDDAINKYKQCSQNVAQFQKGVFHSCYNAQPAFATLQACRQQNKNDVDGYKKCNETYIQSGGRQQVWNVCGPQVTKQINDPNSPSRIKCIATFKQQAGTQRTLQNLQAVTGSTNVSLNGNYPMINEMYPQKFTGTSFNGSDFERGQYAKKYFDGYRVISNDFVDYQAFNY